MLEIAGVRDEGLVLRTRAGREGLVKWNALRHPVNGRTMLAYGDVLTTNTTQGATVSEHIFAMPAGSRQVNAFGAYTSGSRHREMSFIVTSDGAERAEIAGRRPLGDKRQVREPDVVENITRNFARQPVKETALALIGRAENLRTGTIRDMQAGKQGLEQRQVDGKARSTLAGAFGRRHDNARVDATMNTIATGIDQQCNIVQRLRSFTSELGEAVRAAVKTVRRLRETETAKAHVRRRRGPRL